MRWRLSRPDDAGAVASFMADEWVFVSPSGITPKAALIEWIATGRLAHHAMEAIGPPRVAIPRDGQWTCVLGHKAAVE